jgi:hypothetical protein
MKRTLVLVLGTPTVAALFLLAGGTPASAGEQHHQCATQCRPPKTPPPGGWPCRLDHSCASRHHYPPCPPTPPVHHPKPPGTGHHGHNGHRPPVKPPFVAHPVPPIVHLHHATPVAKATPTQLPRTGGTSLPLAFAGGGFVLAGAGLRKLAKVGA